MALQKNIELDNGIILSEAYIVISSINYVNNFHVSVKVNIFKNRQSRLDNKPEVIKFKYMCIDNFSTYFSYDILNEENVNIISKGYDYLKSLPFYSNAIDIMDEKE